ncbi:MAG: ribosomal protein L7/L12 [Caldimonas sp.]
MTPRAEPLPADVLAALQRGSAIEAIKLLRAATGLGLKEAKDVIDQHLQGRRAPIATVAAPATLPGAVAAALQRGDRIEAIRLLREAAGLGLKEAKEAVESFQDAARGAASERAPGEVPRSRAGLWLAIALGAAALLGYSFFRPD